VSAKPTRYSRVTPRPTEASKAVEIERRRPIFYFDLGSPYSYLAAERIHSVLPEPPVWQPILLGGLFKRHGRRSWADTDGRAAGIREVERRARERGLPALSWPEPWPGDMLAAMRAATYAAQIGRAAAFALAAFRQAFVGGRDLSVIDNVLIAAAACELHPRALLAAVGSDQVKKALRATTDEAADLGVVGVPTVAVGGELFWGDDRLEEAADACRRAAAGS
jgi:2-hydroxychromene-2-carboxylate isomerase